MLQQALTLLIGIIGGLAVGFQSPIASSLAQRLGSAAGSLVIHLSGAALSGLVLLIRGGESIGDLRAVPAWMLAGGGFGVILVFTINHTIPRIGAAAAVSLIIVGQLIAAMFIDQFGLLGVVVRAIDGQRLLAAAFLLIGGYLMTR